MKKKLITVLFVLVVALLALTSCTPAASSAANTRPTIAATQAPAVTTFTDPFAYCAAVGDIDKPDARFTGALVSDEIMKGYLKAAGLDVNQEYPDAFKQMTIWRCMGGKVYACNFGANLPCDSKANTDKEPTQGMADFCKESPNSDFIPMYITGHETVYNWHCADETPEVLEQVSQVDAAGYIANIWYPLEGNP